MWTVLEFQFLTWVINLFVWTSARDKKEVNSANFLRKAFRKQLSGWFSIWFSDPFIKIFRIVPYFYLYNFNSYIYIFIIFYYIYLFILHFKIFHLFVSRCLCCCSQVIGTSKWPREWLWIFHCILSVTVSFECLEDLLDFFFSFKYKTKSFCL